MTTDRRSGDERRAMRDEHDTSGHPLIREERRVYDRRRGRVNLAGAVPTDSDVSLLDSSLLDSASDAGWCD